MVYARTDCIYAPTVAEGAEKASKQIRKTREMELRSSPVFKYYFWVGLVLILVLTLLKPAGTDDSGLVERLLIWTLQIALLLPLLIWLHMLLQSFDVFNHLNSWLKLTLSGILGGVLFVPFGLVIDYFFNLDDWSGIANLKQAMPLVLEEIGNSLLPVTLIWIAINAPRLLELNFKEINSGGSPAAAPDDTKAARGASNAFLALVPNEIGNDIVYLKSELHYVRVVTTVGERLVLYNLKDAIADLKPDVRGIQTHRSYWVAGQHIQSITADRGRNFILATGSRRIPVSRRKLSDIRQYMKRLN